MFEVYSQFGAVRGCLLKRNGDQLIFENKQIIDEDICTDIKSGTSYELVNERDDETLTLNFEDNDGGFSSLTVLDVLIHREEALDLISPCERRKMVIRSLNLARSAMVE